MWVVVRSERVRWVNEDFSIWKIGLRSLTVLGDPLAKIAAVVDWEGFRPVLDEAFARPRKSNAGRKEYDRVLMFKVLVLQQLHNLSDDRTEFQIRDRYTFARFLGLDPEGAVPDAKTIWRFREGLKAAQAFDALFAELSSQIASQGLRRPQGSDR